MLDKKSKIFFIIFGFIFILSIFVTYYRYMILKDFTYSTDEEAFKAALEQNQ